MKLLKKTLLALLGTAALVFTAIVAIGRLAWRTIHNWWKKRSKWLRRSVKAISVIIILGFIANIGYKIYDQNYGRYYWDDRPLSGNIMLHCFQDCRYRVYDSRNDKYTTEKLEWVVCGNDTLAVYSDNAKRGFLSTNTGKIVIDAAKNRYTNAWVFSEGVAAVVRDNKIGFIDSENRIVIPFQYDYPACEEGYGTDYLFHNGYCIMGDKEGKLGIIDKKGDWVVKPQYEQILEPVEDGRRIVTKENKYGLLDADMNVVYPTEYDDISITEDGSGIVLTKGGRMWQVDREGNVTNPFMFDCSYWIECPEGYNEDGCMTNRLSPYARYEVKGLYGILDRFTGEPVTLAIYCSINMLSPGLFEVQTPDTYDWHLIDSIGNMVSRE